MSEGPLPAVTSLGGGRYEVADGTRRRVAWASPTPAGTWVFLDGEVFLVRAARAPARRASSHADDDTALAAPMPATVVAIRVTPEQAVARGDVLITLEAMKMEIAIRAPRDGIVRALACREGDLVSPGVPLIELA